jgi:leukemia factor-related protein
LQSSDSNSSCHSTAANSHISSCHSTAASSHNSSLLSLALSKATPRRQRGEKKPIPDLMKDDRYFERRKRNNLAAKKSRDQRKIR